MRHNARAIADMGHFIRNAFAIQLFEQLFEQGDLVTAGACGDLAGDDFAQVGNDVVTRRVRSVDRRARIHEIDEVKGLRGSGTGHVGYLTLL